MNIIIQTNVKEEVKGQSLFEMIVALGVMALIILGLVKLSTFSINNSSSSRNNSSANRYAQETIEWLRGQRDAGWTNFVSRATGTLNVCFASNVWGGAATTTGAYCTSSSCAISGTLFNRGVFFTQETTDPLFPNDTIKAEVRVCWSDSRGKHEVKTTTLFTNWRSVQ